MFGHEKAPDDSLHLSTNFNAPPPCLNCGASAPGRFCSQCGQETALKIIPFRTMAEEFVTEFFSFDRKLFGSVWLLLVKPGFLTQEYVIGRRVRYLSPLRMYLLLSAVCVTLSSQVGDQGMNAVFNLFLCMVPLLALLLTAVYRRPARLYMENLIFALHFHAFAALLLTLTYVVFVLINWVGAHPFNAVSHPQFRAGLFGFWLVAEYSYLALALRAVYKPTLPHLAGTMLAVFGLYSGVIAMIGVANRMIAHHAR